MSPRRMSQPPKANKLSRQERGIALWATAVLLAILADGALRKWLVPPSYQAVPYFAKDVVVSLFLLTHWPRRTARWAQRLMPFVGGLGLCLAPTLVLGLTKAPAGAVVVFKDAVLWPVFAIQIGSYLTPKVVERLLGVALVCTIAMAVLSGSQYFSSPSALINRYAWTDVNSVADIAVSGKFVRATGTFSYITGLSSFSIYMFCVFFGRAISASDAWGRFVGIVGVAAATPCGLVTGSRIVEVVLGVAVIVALFVVPRKYGLRLFAGIAGAAVVLALVWDSSLSQGVLDRWITVGSDEAAKRITNTQVGQPILETLLGNPIGLGLGVYAGVSSYSRYTQDLPYNETFPNRLAAEAGLLGYLAFFLAIGLVARAFFRTLADRDATRKSRLVPIAIVAIIQVSLGQWYDHTGTALLWWTIALWFGDAFGTSQNGLRPGVFPNARLRRLSNQIHPGVAAPVKPGKPPGTPWNRPSTSGRGTRSW